jgi:hypothetical protein
LIAQTPGQAALHLDRIVVGNVELKVWHWLISLGVAVTAASAPLANSGGKPGTLHDASAFTGPR